MKRTNALSFSKVSAFLRCHHAYKLHHKDKTPRSSGEATSVGEVSHDFFEKYAKRCIKLGEPTDLEFGWKLAKKMAMGLEPWMASDFLFLADRFINTHTFPRPAKIETQIGLKRLRSGRWKRIGFDNEEATYRGVIDYLEDRLDDGYILIQDYKTGRVLTDKKYIKSDLQLMSYALMASVLYPEADLFLCQLDFVRFNLRYEPVEFTREEVEEFGRFLWKTIREIGEEKEFEPNYGAARCDWCDFLHRCDEYKKAVKGTDIPEGDLGPEEAKRLAAHMRMLDSGSKRIKSRLKKYVNEKGPIILGDQILDIHIKSKRSFPNSKKVVDKLLDHDIPTDVIWPKVRITVADLNKIVENYKLSEKDAAAILALSVNNPESHFRLEKIKDEKGEKPKAKKKKKAKKNGKG